MAGILRTDTIQNSNTSTIITQTNSTTITIGTTGQTVALASGASSSGFGATYNGAVNWSTTVRTSGFTAVSGNGYFCNTTAGAFTVTLPASATPGDILAFKDYAKTWNTNNLTLATNGLKIEGDTTNATQSTQGQSITLVYIDSTRGWSVVDDGLASSASQIQFVAATGGTVTTCGNYKIHTFTTTGCFVVSNAGNPAGSSSVEYLVLAGGGAGAGGSCVPGGGGGGGGGAGGYRENYPSPAIAGLSIAATTYPIVVGAGGATPSGRTSGNPGSPSVFSTITSAGGGGGGKDPSNSGLPGGSGGGGGGPSGGGGTGNSPPTSPSQGNNGGGSGGASGGGGAGAAGSPSSGGIGITSSITGSSISRAGGGGSGWPTSAPGGGGTGPISPFGAGGGVGNNTNGDNAAVNRGGGGGGAGGNGGPVTGGQGGSGIVVIRYKYQ
jgi:hypothetical protein